MEKIRSWFGPEPGLGLLLLVMGLPILAMLAFGVVIPFGRSVKETFEDPLGNKDQLAFLVMLGLQVGAWLWVAIRMWLRRASSRSQLGPGPELARRALTPAAEAARSHGGRFGPDFMWRLRGSVPIEAGVTNEAALNEVEQILWGQGKRVSDAGTSHIEFDGPDESEESSKSSGSMGLHNKGRFWIEHGPAGRTLRYDLSSFRAFAWSAIAAAVAFVFSPDDALPAGWDLSLIIAGGYAVHVLIALALVPRLIRRAAQA